jgi:galactokinase
VNLIGEHTDYNDGFVLPVAVSLGVWVAAAVHDGPVVAVSREFGPAEPFAPGVPPVLRQGAWQAYPSGVAWALSGSVPTPGLLAYVWSDLPAGSGLSSSAALELAFAQLWNALAGSPLDPMRLALACQRAEHEAVGVRCGLMDQLASACGVEGAALLVDVRDQTLAPVDLPASLAIVVCDTGTPRTLAGSVYNVRRHECEVAARALGLTSLRDADPLLLDSARLEPGLLKRVRHVVEENARVLAMSEALRGRRKDEVSRLMLDSHESLRNNYEVTTVELDEMANLARRTEGCWGCRMTGAGMGGACVALVEKPYVDRFVDKVTRGYRALRLAGSPALYAVHAAPGALALPWSGNTTLQGLAGEKSCS